MSKLFFDHLITLEEVDVEIKNISQNPEEKEELWKLVDDIVNHRMMITILDNLPLEHHEEFLKRFHEAPFHDGHIDFLNQHLKEDIEVIIKREVGKLKSELLQEIKALKEKK
jgi:hypothetical protein